MREESKRNRTLEWDLLLACKSAHHLTFGPLSRDYKLSCKEGKRAGEVVGDWVDCITAALIGSSFIRLSSGTGVSGGIEARKNRSKSPTPRF